MATLNDNNHIYEIVLYRACLEAETTLLQADNIFEWDYPQLPMDLCFYRNGYAWFSSSSHEHYADIILENKKEIKEIESLGIKATFHCEFNDERYLFKEDMLKIKIKDLKEAIYLSI